jgi:hypothetical protein
MTDSLSQYIAETLALRPGRFETPKQSLSATEGAVLEIGEYGLTNDTSRRPILATAGLHTCMGIALYNPRTKTALLVHAMPEGGEQEAKDTMRFLLEKIRIRPEDKIDVHLVGCNASSVEFDEKKEKPYLDVMKEVNHIIKGYVEAIFADKHAELRTYAVDTVPHHNAFAIDARTGSLIRGTELLPAPWSGAGTATSLERLKEFYPNLEHQQSEPIFQRWDGFQGDAELPMGKPLRDIPAFDGTKPEQQRPKGRDQLQ